MIHNQYKKLVVLSIFFLFVLCFSVSSIVDLTVYQDSLKHTNITGETHTIESCPASDSDITSSFSSNVFAPSFTAVYGYCTQLGNFTLQNVSQGLFFTSNTAGGYAARFIVMNLTKIGFSENFNFNDSFISFNSMWSAGGGVGSNSFISLVVTGENSTGNRVVFTIYLSQLNNNVLQFSTDCNVLNFTGSSSGAVLRNLVFTRENIFKYCTDDGLISHPKISNLVKITAFRFEASNPVGVGVANPNGIIGEFTINGLNNTAFPNVNVSVVNSSICAPENTTINTPINVSINVVSSSPFSTLYSIVSPEPILDSTVTGYQTNFNSPSCLSGLLSGICNTRLDSSIFYHTGNPIDTQTASEAAFNNSCGLGLFPPNFVIPISDSYKFTLNPFIYSLILSSSLCTHGDRAFYLDLGQSYNSLNFIMVFRAIPIFNNSRMNITFISDDKITEINHIIIDFLHNETDLSYENSETSLFSLLHKKGVNYMFPGSTWRGIYFGINMVSDSSNNYIDFGELKSDTVLGFPKNEYPIFPLNRTIFHNDANGTVRYIRIGLASSNSSNASETFIIDSFTTSAAKSNLNMSVFTTDKPNTYNLFLGNNPITIYYTDTTRVSQNFYSSVTTNVNLLFCSQLANPIGASPGASGGFNFNVENQDVIGAFHEVSSASCLISDSIFAIFGLSLFTCSILLFLYSLFTFVFTAIAAGFLSRLGSNLVYPIAMISWSIELIVGRFIFISTDWLIIAILFSFITGIVSLITVLFFLEKNKGVSEN